MRNELRHAASGILTALVFIAGLSRVMAQQPAAPSLVEIQQLITDGDLRQAEASAQARLSSLDSIGSRDSEEAARTIDLLMRALELQGFTRPGVELARRAMQIREINEGEDSLAYAASLSTYARWLTKTGKWRETKPLYEKVLAVRTRLLGPDHVDVARSLSDLAVVHIDLGDWQVARERLERAMEIVEKSVGLDGPEAGIVVNNLGELLEDLGDYESERLLYERRLQAMRKRTGLPQQLGQIRLLLRIAKTWDASGDAVSARSSYEQALEMWKGVEAKVIDSPEPGPIKMAELLQRLAVTHELMKDIAAARDGYLKAILLREKGQGPEHPNLAWPLRDLAIMLLDAGDAAGAEPFIERACRLLEPFPPDRHLAACLSVRGRVLMEMGRADAALPLLERATEILRRSHGERHPELSQALVSLAHAELSAGRIQAGRDHALQAEEIARRHFQRTASWLSEREALRFEQVRVSGLDLAVSSLASRPPPDPSAAARTVDAVIRSRALVLDEFAARRNILSSGADEQVVRLFHRLEGDRNRLARFIATRGESQVGEEAVATLRAMMEEKEQSERELAAKSAVFRRRQTSWELGLDAVRGALPPESALVAYLKYEKSSLAGEPRSVPSYLGLVLSSSREAPAIVPLGDARSIDSLIAAWREAVTTSPAALKGAVSKRETDARARGERLRGAIWDPLSRHLGDAKTILVIPDGALHLVNLAALPDRGQGYLVESEVLIHYLSAERDLVRLAGSRVAGSGLLLMGGPDYDHQASEPSRPERVASVAPRMRSAPSRTLASLRFEPLPAAAAEAEQIHRIWRSGPGGEGSPDPSRLLTRAAATEGALKDLAPGRRIVHIATHGFFAAPAGNPSLRLDNPLLATGLAFAGANSRAAAGADQEDGLLLAEEIASSDLGGVEWVVLSACESALGDVRDGEGVLGLRRVFETAGAGTLIMSLWPIEDQATHDWMKGLYRARLDGLSTAASMRRASVERIHARRKAGLSTHPFFWGAFVAAGEWR